jgi:hypothetical protein
MKNSSKSKRKIIETEAILIPLTHYTCPLTLSWLGTGTSIKSGGIKLVIKGSNLPS